MNRAKLSGWSIPIGFVTSQWESSLQISPLIIAHHPKITLKIFNPHQTSSTIEILGEKHRS
jgi:hypothetical protein